MKIHKTIMPTIYEVFLVILLFPFFWPMGTVDIVPYNLMGFRTVWAICSVVVVAWLYVRNRHFKISKMMVLIILFEVMSLLSTLVNEINIWQYLLDCASVITVCLFIESQIMTRTRSLLRALMFLLGSEYLINLVTVIAFPNGITQKSYDKNVYIWLLGGGIILFTKKSCLYYVYS